MQAESSWEVLVLRWCTAHADGRTCCAAAVALLSMSTAGMLALARIKPLPCWLDNCPRMRSCVNGGAVTQQFVPVFVPGDCLR